MSQTKGLSRQLGLTGLVATGICSMLGASVYVVPIMIQRNVPGIGPNVLPAFLFAALPAILAAFAYAQLSSAMPKTGGSYIYASRGLNPYLGFIASFSQWFGLSIAIGVISYIIIPFLRDIALAMDWVQLGQYLDQGGIRVFLAIAMLWLFVGININGLKLYERTLIPLMILMFGLGFIVIIAGLLHNHQDFAQALMEKENRTIPDMDGSFKFSTFLAAAALLFSSFIGFDSIAQAGGEAKNPKRTLPLAILIAVFGVGTYYFLFTSAVYHTVPWSFIAEEAADKDLSAPGLMAYVLSPAWAVAIIAGAAIALINDLPAMLLSVSRLMFSWAEDGIFPKGIAKIHPKKHTPVVALILSGVMATIGILGSHFAGDFFLGIDIMVTSMLVNFLLMCITVLSLPKHNPEIAKQMRLIESPVVRNTLAILGSLLLLLFLVVHLIKDFQANLEAWYFHSTPIWLIVMSIASIIYFWKTHQLKQSGKDLNALFKNLPESE
jgi:amino acid transporter